MNQTGEQGDHNQYSLVILIRKLSFWVQKYTLHTVGEIVNFPLGSNEAISM